MGFRFLAASLAGLLLAPICIVASAERPDVTWCPDASVIEFDQCREKAPNDGNAWISFRREHGCFASPQRALVDETPTCRTVQLIDERFRTPITHECQFGIEGRQRLVRGHWHLGDGLVRVPSWANKLEVSCPGFANVALDAHVGGSTVVVPRGRVLQIDALGGETPGDFKETGSIDLKQVAGTFSVERHFSVGKPVYAGSVPLGEYHLKITLAGAATIVDDLMVSESESALELLYRLVRGRCLEVPVKATNPGVMGGVGFELLLLSENKPPRLQTQGQLALHPTGGDRWLGKICDLPLGRYELTLQSSGFVPVTRILDLDAASSPPEPFQFLHGECSWVDVISEEGIPLPGAAVVVSWDEPRGRQRGDLTTNDQGRARLPCLPSNSRFRIYVDHNDFVSENSEWPAGTPLLMVLRPAGSITAQVTGACKTSSDLELTVEVTEDGPGRRQEAHRLDECALNVPVKRPGTYRLTLSGPDVKPYRKEISLVNDLSTDLGKIELERGDPLRIKVVHGEQPVPGASVRLSREGAARVTDERGIVEFAVLDDESNVEEIFVSHSDYAPRRIVQDTSSRERDLVVQVSHGGEIDGRVLYPDGSPAVAEVIIAAGSDQLNATVDGRGHYRFSGLDPGQWRVSRLRMFGEGRSANTMGLGDFRVVKVHENEVVELDFVPTVDVRGRVFRDGRLVGEATIAAIHERESAEYGTTSATVRVDESGQYEARLPLPGAWTFFYGGESYSAQIVSCPCVVDMYFPPSKHGSRGPETSRGEMRSGIASRSH